MPAMQRPAINKTKRKLKAGEMILGLYCTTMNPDVVEVLGAAGYDFIVFDIEHNNYSIAQCMEAIRAAELVDLTPLIRVYDNSERLINKALESGAQGVFVPHVDTPELAKRAVDATKYPPQGTRGVNPGSRANGYGGGNWDEKWRRANEETMVVLQPLESLEGIRNLGAILQVPGIDLISLGVGDISQVLGAPGNPNDPRVKKTHEEAMALCRKHGVPPYALASRPEDVKAYYDKGLRAFMAGGDLGFVANGARTLVSGLRAAVKPEPTPA